MFAALLFLTLSGAFFAQNNCLPCHEKQVLAYKRTGMARSLSTWVLQGGTSNTSFRTRGSACRYATAVCATVSSGMDSRPNIRSRSQLDRERRPELCGADWWTAVPITDIVVFSARTLGHVSRI